jgi:hypothetical protein
MNDAAFPNPWIGGPLKIVHISMQAFKWTNSI